MLDLFHRGRKEGKVDLKYSDEFLILYFQAMVEGISKPEIYAKLLPYTAEWTEVLIRNRTEEEIKHKKAETDDKMSVRLFWFINDVKSSRFACFFVIDIMDIDEWIKNRIFSV